MSEVMAMKMKTGFDVVDVFCASDRIADDLKVRVWRFADVRSAHNRLRRAARFSYLIVLID